MRELGKLNILVTGACGVTSRSVVRSLKTSAHFGNARFVGTDICHNLYGIAEGLYDVIYRVPHSSDKRYGETINEVCHREGIDLAIVIPELEVLYWSQNRMPVASLLPPPDFCEVAGSKVSLYRALDESGAVPQFAILARDRLMDQGFESPVGWPCWVRDHQIGSTSGRGSLLASNQ